MERRMVRICNAGDQLSARVACESVSELEGRELGRLQRTLENVKADATELVDIGVKDLCEESNLRRGHRVVIGQEQLELEDTTFSRY